MAKYTSLSQVQSALQSGVTSCQQLIEEYLDHIAASQSLNIYIELFEEEARERAKALDIRYAEDPASLGRLHGVVISIKDVLCYAGHRVTGGSKMLEGFESVYTATAIQRLLDEDAIIIGRVNCDEFAMGSSNEHSYYGPTRNAADQERIPGGSSGASAVSVQAGTCLVSIGSDTGGSVRQPAAFCGVVGVKPSYGRISRYGLLAYASSFDQIGILANSVEDAALTLEIMAGADEFDSTASTCEVEPYSQKLEYKKKARIAYFDSALQHESLDEEIKKGTFDFIERLQKEGHTVEAVDFDYLNYIVPAYYVLTTAEASSNLSRYDGVRYGYRSPDVGDLMETYKKTRTEGFGAEVKRRIMLGTFVLSAGYYNAYYTKAQKVRQLIAQQTAEIFDSYDFILMPTTPSVAWKLGEKIDDPVATYLADIYTVQANMAGIPAISIPLGTHSNQLPYGIQLMASRFQEAELLAFAKQMC